MPDHEDEECDEVHVINSEDMSHWLATNLTHSTRLHIVASEAREQKFTIYAWWKK